MDTGPDRLHLKYVDADDLDDTDLDFGGMKVRNDAGDKLGEVDGFLVDGTTARPFYVVVDAGGWFKSKHFLMPIGHARLDEDRDALVVDLSRERIERFPGFDRDRFDTLSDADLARIHRETALACCGDAQDTGGALRYEEWTHYRQPEWWQDTRARADRAGGAAAAVASVPSGYAGRDSISGRGYDDVTARQRDSDRAGEIDPSPHAGGRAQPGDVIGLETGGEQTHIGETAEDENTRRRDAEDDARKAQERAAEDRATRRDRN